MKHTDSFPTSSAQEHRLGTKLFALQRDDTPQSSVYLLSGSATRPKNKMQFDSLCRIRNTNGWSARNIGSDGNFLGIIPVRPIITVVAAASVPFSFVSTKTLCITV